MIGRYKLLEKIGEGGFGVVFLAAQTEPVKRRVALKVIKPGMDSKEVIARFEAERQALALMDHPNIARVHDAGATDQGRPYFVMELVRGIPITKYCDDLSLKIPARLELFIDVCAAVQHAHQKGIIHRDLKPSNILVSAQDDQPTVKVIDFGIAKAISMELTEKTVFTELGRMIGTPQYMSPEQAYLNAVDVDTRSDIHSLGVVLYELLTGSTPLDPETLRNAGYAEIQTMIRNDLAVRPSAYVSSLGDRLAPIASKRKVEPGKLTKILRGDLDWIVLKALEKDRTRRYQSCNGLGSDVQRYLNDEPVSASPPSLTYRCIQFAKRHRTGVTWTAVLAAVLMAAMVIISILGLQAIKAEKEALRLQYEATLSDANTIRKEKGEPERRWKAIDKLKSASEILRKIDVDADGPATPAGSESKRRLRDYMISTLATPDMRSAQKWTVDPARDGDGEVVVADQDLRHYASTFRDDRIALHRFDDLAAEPRILVNPDGQIAKALKFSPHGKILAATYDTGEAGRYRLKLWRIDGDELVSCDSAVDTTGAFAFFGDSARCAIGTPDGGVTIIKSSTGEAVNHLAFSLPGIPHSISVSEGDEFLAVSIPAEDRVVVMQADDGTVTTNLECENPRILEWGPVDGSLAACTASFIAVWRGLATNLQNPEPALELRGGITQEHLAWSPDGRLIASHSGTDRTSRLWDPFRGEELCSHYGSGSSLGFSRDGTKLGIVRKANSLSMFEVAPGDVCLRGRGHPRELEYGIGGIFDGVWNEDKEGALKVGSLMATTGSDGVRIWNREGRHLGHIAIPEARGIAISRDALFVASQEGLFKWKIKSEPLGGGRTQVTIGAREPVSDFFQCEGASLTHVGNWLAVAAESRSDPGRRRLWLIDLDGELAPYPLPGSEGAANCAISADDRWLAAGFIDPCQVSVWAMAAGDNPQPPATPVRSFPIPLNGTASVAFSPLPVDLETGDPTGEAVPWLVTGDANQYQFWSTDTWEMESGQSIESNMGDRSCRMAFSSRGTALALAVEGEKLKVYAFPYTGGSPVPLEFSSPDFDREIPLCFSPYGRILATIKPSGEIFFWKLDEVRKQLKELNLDWRVKDFRQDREFDFVSRVVISTEAVQ